MQRIQGMPYVPGTVRALITRDPRDGCIWLAEQSGIGSLRAQPAGAIVVDAAPFSHSMIALLARGVPTVLLTREQAGTLREGEVVQLDGAAGCVVSPEVSPQSLTPVPVAPPAGRAVHTADNVAVELRASVRDAAGARRAHANGACAIGLVRSEFLVPPDGAIPDADFYEQALGQLCAAAQSLPVVIRLLDIAPDKRPAWLGALSEKVGPLGLQGARLFDHEPVAGVVQAQLEAVARLQRLHALRLLLPYVRSTEEIRLLRDTISEQLAKPLLVGVMLETPAAALEIAQFCEAADFVALGTNDLMQCLFGADRDRPEVASLLDPYAPVLYRFLRSVAENAGPHLIRVQVCGLLAQLSGCLDLLLGLGFRVFSVDPVFIPYLAETVARTDTARARTLAEQVCAAPSSREARFALERQHATG
jgi:phosphoenolpyruvate-protein kinase (PTS system EI component)